MKDFIRTLTRRQRAATQWRSSAGPTARLARGQGHYFAINGGWIKNLSVQKQTFRHLRNGL